MRWRDKISNKRAWREVRLVSFFLLLFGFYLLILGIHHLFFPWERSDFVTYEASLEKSPDFDKSRSGTSLKLVFEDSKQFVFVIDGDNYSALTGHDQLSALKPGDVVKVLVDKEMLNAKVRRTIPATFLQRIINWDQVRVYELIANGHVCLPFERVIDELKKAAWFCFSWGLIQVLVTVFYLRREYRIYYG